MSKLAIYCRNLTLAVLVCLTCTRATLEPPRLLPNDAYIWQYIWTQALGRAIASSTGLVQSWRVLVSETGRHRQIIPGIIDWQALWQANIIAVFRIDGRLNALDTAPIISGFTAVRASSARVTGIEIDYDCPTSRLDDYARFLGELRRQLPPDIRLSITALPTWLSSPRFPAVSRAADEIVLQVHAVQKPGAGLFDARQAMAWVNDLADKTRKPFRVALPTYGTHVTLATGGAIIALESESPALESDPNAGELIAMPTAVSDFVQALQQRSPAALTGIVWFRLPTDVDSDAWSLATWQSVARGQYHAPALTASLQTGGRRGLSLITLANPQAVDGELPAALVLDKNCTAGDGANGYALVQTQGGLRFDRLQIGLLHGHDSRIIGWARCNQERPM